MSPTRSDIQDQTHPVQARNEEGVTTHYATVANAIQAQKELDPTIWKISFDAKHGERIRLTHDGEEWLYDPIIIPGDEA